MPTVTVVRLSIFATFDDGKNIVAFIKPNMLEDVVSALHKIEDLPGVTIHEVRGIGRGIKDCAGEGNQAPLHTFRQAIRMEIMCREDRVDEFVGVIKKSAYTGRPDDGKIFVSPVEQAFRIRTEEIGRKRLSPAI